jgi:hypothetical protein
MDSSVGEGMALVMTCGLAEVGFFSRELLIAGRRTICGQVIRFEYDAAGHVARAYLDGDEIQSPDYKNRVLQRQTKSAGETAQPTPSDPIPLNR